MTDIFTPETHTEDWKKSERLKCASDFKYWAKNYWWFKPKGNLSPLRLDLNKAQLRMLTESKLAFANGKILLEFGRRQTGKCWKINTECMMFDGTIKKVQNIEINDVMMGDDSTPRRVVSTVHGIGEMFEIKSRNGYSDSYTVNEDHILCVAKHFHSVGNKKVIIYEDMPLKKYLTVKNKGRYFGYKKEVFFPEKKISVDPYWLGLWLGDGNSRNTQICKPDKEISEYCKEYAEKSGMRAYLHKSKEGSVEACSIVSNKTKKGSNPLLNELRVRNLILNKHIPCDYLMNSTENRLRLLAGLIDTDGHKPKHQSEKNSCEIVFTNKRLSEETVFLARSLGFRVSIKEKKATIKKIGYSCVAYRMWLYGDLWRVPTRIERKKYKNTGLYNEPLLCGFDVIPKGIGDYYGFTLEGDNKRFLLGDFTVAHNTELRAATIYHALNFKPTIDIYYTSKDDDAVTAFKNRIFYGHDNMEPFLKQELVQNADDVLRLGWKRGKETIGGSNSAIHFKSPTPKCFDSDPKFAYYLDEAGLIDFVDRIIMSNLENLLDDNQNIVSQFQVFGAAGDPTGEGAAFAHIFLEAWENWLNCGEDIRKLKGFFYPTFYDAFWKPGVTKEWLAEKIEELSRNAHTFYGKRMLDEFKRNNPTDVYEALTSGGDYFFDVGAIRQHINVLKTGDTEFQKAGIEVKRMTIKRTADEVVTSASNSSPILYTREVEKGWKNRYFVFIDPIDMAGESETKSDGAVWIYDKKLDEKILMYSERPDDIMTFYETCLAITLYADQGGANDVQAVIERQRGRGLITYFSTQGFFNLMALDPGIKDYYKLKVVTIENIGIHMTEQIRENGLTKQKSWLSRNLERELFKAYLDQCCNFRWSVSKKKYMPAAHKKGDLITAFGMGLEYLEYVDEPVMKDNEAGGVEKT